MIRLFRFGLLVCLAILLDRLALAQDFIEEANAPELEIEAVHPVWEAFETEIHAICLSVSRASTEI